MQTADIAPMLAAKKYFANFLGLISIIGPSSPDFIDFERTIIKKGYCMVNKMWFFIFEYQYRGTIMAWLY